MFIRRLLITAIALSLLMASSNSHAMAKEWQRLDSDIFVRDLSLREIRYYLSQGIKNNPSLLAMFDKLSIYNLKTDDILNQSTLVGKIVISTARNGHRGGVIVGEFLTDDIVIKFVYMWSSNKSPQAGLAVRQVTSNVIRIFEVRDGNLREKETTLDAVKNFSCATAAEDNSTQSAIVLAQLSSKCSGCLEACNFLGGLHCTITAAVLCAMVCGTTAGLGCPVGCAIAFYLVCYAGLRNCNYLCSIGGACP